ncbi:MAG: glycoside hydrolase family 127 protein [Planctomycetes bacterium]|nr:glycoside hydrolase family 127 protein [Planctomycetota bacterium]
MRWMAAALTVFAAAGSASGAADYPLQPVPFTAVRFADEFFAPRLETNRRVTIPYAFAKCEETGRIDNFAIAGGLLEGEHRGDFPFDDTDPYKILEGASYSLSVRRDPDLEQYLDGLIEKIAAAQEDDGYLYTCRTNGATRLERWFGPERWSRLSGSHELYNAGHLYEAAVAHFRATGKRSLLEVALKNADLVARTFGEEGLRAPPGHQVIEMGLVKLFRATGDEKYLKLAKFFLDERGRARGRELYGAYSQDHLPVVEQEEAVGHAVRATYLYAGMADVAALCGDQEYVRAIDRLFENVVGRKLYVTGGVGARGDGEAFGEDYELPNLTAYCETCAAIGNAMWNHRMVLLHADAKYADVLERVLMNGVLSGVSLGGDAFFYDNPLESRGQHQRSPWFGCACCPGNVARFIPSIPGYAYAQRGDELFVILFAAGEARVEMGQGALLVRQETRYPWDGDVRLVLEPEREAEFTVYVRVPGWARGEALPGGLYRFAEAGAPSPELSVNGAPCALELEGGFARVRRVWQKGDVIELELPMPVRRVLCDEKVRENQGRVALQRGPIVYCLEGADHAGGRVLNLLVPDDAELSAEPRADLLGGVTVVRGRGIAFAQGEAEGTVEEAEQEFLAVPYCVWAHRGPGEMTVWLAGERRAARPLPRPTLASAARLTTSGGTNPGAINDRLEPASSGDHEVPFFHWWPRKGTVETVELEFAQAESVSRASVYWFDDTGRGECRVPASWSLLYRDGDAWKPVAAAGPFGVDKDRFNRVAFEPVLTTGLRLEVRLPEGFSAGIHEWTVE